MNPKNTNSENANNVTTPGEYRAAEGNVDTLTPEAQSDHLQWLAFCYIADELTAEQRTDFESLLATDLQAQEALSSAVGLGREIHESYQLQPATPAAPLLERPVTPAAERTPLLSRMLLLAAAVLIMASIGYGLVRDNCLNTVGINHQNESSSALQLSSLAEDWINGLDETGDDFKHTACPKCSEQSSDIAGLAAVNSDNELDVDTSLISFYSEMLDEEEGLLDSNSSRRIEL